MSVLVDAASVLRENGSVFERWSGLLKEVSALGAASVEWHPLGFCRIDVSMHIPDRAPLERFFLHVWRKDAPVDSLGVLHTHVFDMTSIVLCGEVENSTYRVSGDCEESDSVGEYLVNYGNKSVTRIRGVQLTPHCRRTFSAGCLYRVGVGVPHESRIVAHPTVTLIRKLYPLQPESGPRIFSTGTVDSKSSERPRIEVADIKSLIDAELKR